MLVLHRHPVRFGHFYLGRRAGLATDHNAAGPVADRQFSGGSADIEFWSSWKTPNTTDVPLTVTGPVSGRQTSTNWVEQFFGAGAVFNSGANPDGPDLGNWSWRYTLGFGSDKACPNDACQWVDSAGNGSGAQNGDGNILTPNATDCT